jgi:hypothetical protein
LLVCLNIKKKGKDWLAFLPKIYWPVPVGGGGGGGGLLPFAPPEPGLEEVVTM